MPTVTGGAFFVSAGIYLVLSLVAQNLLPSIRANLYFGVRESAKTIGMLQIALLCIAVFVCLALYARYISLLLKCRKDAAPIGESVLKAVKCMLLMLLYAAVIALFSGLISLVLYGAQDAGADYFSFSDKAGAVTLIAMLLLLPLLLHAFIRTLLRNKDNAQSALPLLPGVKVYGMFLVASAAFAGLAYFVGELTWKAFSPDVAGLVNMIALTAAFGILFPLLFVLDLRFSDKSVRQAKPERGAA
jgi:hypothetical protein